MSKDLQYIFAPEKDKALAPVTPGICWGDLVFVAGQVPRSPDGPISGTTIREQTRTVIENLNRVLTAAGSSLDGVVKTTVYLTSIADMKGMNEVYLEAFAKSLPTRTTVQVSALANPAYLVEIDAIAIRVE